MTTRKRGRPAPRPAPRTSRDTSGQLHRSGDHASSIEGARAVAARAPSQKIKLLIAFRTAGEDGLTDEEAADIAGLNNGISCWWHRCTDLRHDGLIWEKRPTEYREGRAGVKRIISAITPEGYKALTALGL